MKIYNFHKDEDITTRYYDADKEAIAHAICYNISKVTTLDGRLIWEKKESCSPDCVGCMSGIPSIQKCLSLKLNK